MLTSKAILLLGGGGHARVCAEIVELCGGAIAGYLAPLPAEGGMKGYPYLGTDEILKNYKRDQYLIVNGVGSTGAGMAREHLYDRVSELGFTVATLIHPRANVSPSAVAGEGAQIMAGAVIQPGTVIGRNAILNTSAVVDHDCQIGDHVHIAPGAVLCGSVRVGAGAHIGAGATVIQNIQIGAHARIGAGAVVVRDVSERVTVMGIPAKEAAK